VGDGVGFADGGATLTTFTTVQGPHRQRRPERISPARIESRVQRCPRAALASREGGTTPDDTTSHRHRNPRRARPGAPGRTARRATTITINLIASPQLIYDVARFNTERLPAFHRLDVRIDRKFRLFGRNTSLSADMQNLYDRRAVIEYSWNQKTRELYAEKQLEFLPIVGINIEF
jgi:hypothetical protein